MISLLMLSLFLLISATEAPALFGPEVIDVTPKAFSVVWTTDSDYSSCGIGLYTDNTYTTLMNLTHEMAIIVGTPEGHPGKNNHIAMVSVVGLNYYTTYYFRLFLDGNVMPFYGSVRTERLRGVSSYDEGTFSSDVVSNDVVHKAIYKPDGTSPAKGVLVMGEILDPVLFHANPNDPDAIISDHPISAWVGEGMIGDETATEYNPNNISYGQYAALNMNNLFDGDRYPLSLHGDDPSTETINEGEIVRFTILHGEQDVLGSETNQHWFTSYGHIGVLDIAGGDKITTAKISASFRFKKGVNLFALPCKIPSGFTTGDLWDAIERAEGKEGIVESIYVLEENIWLKTFKTLDPITGTKINNINPLPYGDGAFIIMNQDMTKEVSFYGDAESLRIDLFSDEVNIIGILPQTPLFYETGHFLNDIESAGAGESSVENIWFYDGGWKRTYKIDHPLFGPQIQNSVRMSNIKFYVVIFKDSANDLLDFDPFAVKQKRRLRSSKPTFFY
ncbi:MAG: hypothetical protein ACMUIM_10130 [bacterium]